MTYILMNSSNSPELNKLISERNKRLVLNSQSNKSDYGRPNYYSQTSVGTKSNQYIYPGGFHNTSNSTKPGVW